MSKNLKATVKCIKILSCATSAYPVIVASFRQGPRYVLLSHDARSALTWSALGYMREGSSRVPREAFPALVRGHAIDPETGGVYEGSLAGREGIWSNGEDLWVRVATGAYDPVGYRVGALSLGVALAEWRKTNPWRETVGCWAPNWACWSAIRAIFLAAGEADPADSVEADRAALGAAGEEA